MIDPAVNGIRIDVVGPADGKVSLAVGPDRRVGVAQSAADVDVSRGIGRDQTRILTAPCPLDLGNRCRGCRAAGTEQNDQANPCCGSHTLTLVCGALESNIFLSGVRGLDLSNVLARALSSCWMFSHRGAPRLRNIRQIQPTN